MRSQTWFNQIRKNTNVRNSNATNTYFFLYVLSCLLALTQSFAPTHHEFQRPVSTTKQLWKQQRQHQSQGQVSTSSALNSLAGSGLESVVAGAIAGAIGIGVAFPFDAIRTQVQILSTSGRTVESTTAADGTVTVTRVGKTPSMFDAMRVIWDREGFAGFFNGVQSMMIGQAICKSMAFSTNSFAITFLSHNDVTKELPHSLILFMAACFAGFVASFVVTPVERVSVMMQAQNKYASEWECLQAVMRKDGVVGVCTRGLGATFAREVPSDGIYFWMYGILSHSQYSSFFGNWGPLAFGAFAGMASWVPIYWVDVVKSVIQNTDADDDSPSNDDSFFDVAKELYEQGGIGAFFDGFDAKLLRAGVHHAMTFAVYEAVIGYIRHAHLFSHV